MSNKRDGTTFELDFAKKLAAMGFWVHRLQDNAAGQPADIIAVRDQKAFLIDCKVCGTVKGFVKSRVEPNQEGAMALWKGCGNRCGWFAMLLEDEIYMITFDEVFLAPGYALSPQQIKHHWTLAEWGERY